ncbi:glycosyltransferase family 2 protein [Flavobacteriaceae bacterium]|jgi:GT2 family glycosyltransferase|nr:glycosyltransferase family 2 protein [Flavobacteriaceae bacterium]
MVKNSKIAIIIVNWKQYQLTKLCLYSLQKIKYDNYQIILIDNESNPKELKKIKNQFDKIITFPNQKNLGFTGANNIGIEYAIKNDFEYVMLINNDTEVEKNFINPLIELLEKNQNFGAAQPLILNYYNRNKVWSAGGFLNKFFGYTYVIKSPEGIKKNIDWITGCCFFLRTDVIKKIGLLDEKFFAYYEDVDWSIRIKNAGYDLAFVKSSVVYHHGSKSSKNESNEGTLSPFVHYLNIRNHIFLLRKNKDVFNSVGVLFFQFFKIVSYSVYFIVRVRINKLNMVYKGLVDGLMKNIIHK